MRILVAEGEALFARRLVRELTEQGYTVDGTGSGREAERWASAHDYDVVLLGLDLADGDGIEILRVLRTEGTGPAIIVVAAWERHSDPVTLLDLGADDYVTKPVAVEELAARVRAVARRSGRPPSC